MKNPIKMEVFPKTIYTDIVAMPSSILAGVTIHYYNESGATLYMKIFVAGTNWSSNSVEMGTLATGGHAYRNLDNFTARNKPAAETTEAITFTLKGYSDAGYLNEVASFSRDVTVIILKSDDGSWTLDEHDDFEAGVDGWAWLWEVEGHTADSCTLAHANDYKIEGTWSLKASCRVYYSPFRERRIRLYKQYTTTSIRDNIYAIINFRISADRVCTSPNISCCNKYLRIQRDDTVLTHIGRQFEAAEGEWFPRNKWIRLVVPLPKDTTLDLRVVVSVAYYSDGNGENYYIWLDDIKIISK